jgi:hypothetical protein
MELWKSRCLSSGVDASTITTSDVCFCPTTSYETREQEVMDHSLSGVSPSKGRRKEAIFGYENEEIMQRNVIAVPMIADYCNYNQSLGLKDTIWVSDDPIHREEDTTIPPRNISPQSRKAFVSCSSPVSQQTDESSADTTILEDDDDDISFSMCAILFSNEYDNGAHSIIRQSAAV